MARATGIGGVFLRSLASGRGLVHDIVFEPHFAELGGFPCLTEAMHRSGCRFGVGIDEPLGIVIEGRRGTALGAGRGYLLDQNGASVTATVLRPGDALDLPLG